MANRFLETNYFKSPFVRGLDGSLKSLYSFIICDCTPSGIWSADFEAASLYIGFDVKLEDFTKNFIDKGKAIPLGKSKYFFPDFIEHQYPKGLQGTNKAHNNIIKDLNKIGVIDENNNVKIKGASMVPEKAPLEGRQGIGNGNGNGNGNAGGLKEKLLCPAMSKILKKHIPVYAEDTERDYQPLLSIGQFIFNTEGYYGNVLDNTDKICKEWDLICAWLKGDSFYSQKSLKTISTHIQEISTKAKHGDLKLDKNMSESEKKLLSDREKYKDKKYTI